MTRPKAGRRKWGDLPTWGDHQEATRRIKHDALIEAAGRIVATEGRDRLTMERLAEAVGCATGTVYIYFPSKDALLEQVDARALEALRVLLEDIRGCAETKSHNREQGSPCMARLVAMAGVLSEPASEDEGAGVLRRVLSGSGASLHKERIGEIVAILGDAITEAASAGDLECGDGLHRAKVLLATAAAAPVLDGNESEGEPLTPPSGTALARALLLSWGARHRTLVGAGELLNRSLQRFEPGKEELESTGVMACSLRPWDDEPK